ncbi:DUF2982 domain-containing protein [Paraglaciecola aquimarina]|uniref:DUF2982 domain-containing protein n=1 Tax=Paraglaciecola algarum TaxID=3050085 RepID=A0ABS9DAG6_9ALTE|nr:DUF2982 domain-containing protein [Paraglaciecola sp. G1-23]MCF2949013.1 DUF2982 domain-containing protein [Paraglaciecola sp. G1-23]
MSDIIQIRSLAKKNILVSSLSGFLGLCFGLILLSALPKEYYLVGIFVISLACVMLIIAWVKYREPTFSFELTKYQIIYRSRHGKWQLNWENIQRIDIPKVSVGMENRELGMLGFKLKDYVTFLDNISPRLMTNMLMEQRPLLFHQLSAGQDKPCSTGQCLGQDLLENDYYKDLSGKEYKGIQGMFANRMIKLRANLGYDIFVAASDLDRPEQEFLTLLKQCQNQVLRCK